MERSSRTLALARADRPRRPAHSCDAHMLRQYRHSRTDENFRQYQSHFLTARDAEALLLALRCAFAWRRNSDNAGCEGRHLPLLAPAGCAPLQPRLHRPAAVRENTATAPALSIHRREWTARRASGYRSRI